MSHHGIKGQKWGVRRYQNEDGTLTDAGKKRREQIIQRVDNAAKAAEKHGLNKNDAIKSALNNERSRASGDTMAGLVGVGASAKLAASLFPIVGPLAIAALAPAVPAAFLAKKSADRVDEIDKIAEEEYGYFIKEQYKYM